MDPTYKNFNSIAVVDDGSCLGISIHNKIEPVSIQTYPQPINDRLYVSIESLMDYDLADFVQIKNIIGETILSKEIDSKSNLIELNMAAVISGVYYLVLEINNEVIIKKLIVE